METLCTKAHAKYGPEVETRYVPTKLGAKSNFTKGAIKKAGGGAWAPTKKGGRRRRTRRRRRHAGTGPPPPAYVQTGRFSRQAKWDKQRVGERRRC